ncbi:hypothetical protein DK26_23290 [Bosea sp. WAO]|nr:hypothetical protein DK26_23290 [Bosea sp. WAO]
MLAKAEAIDQAPPRFVAMTQVRDAVASAAGIDAASVQLVIRGLRECGLRPSRQRGPTTCSLPLSEAALILIAVLAARDIKSSAASCTRLMQTRIELEVGPRPHQLLTEAQTLCDLVEALIAVLIAEPTATARIQVNQTDLCALVQVELNSAGWSAFFPPLRAAAGDRHEIAAVSEITLRAIADLFREAQP